MIDMHESNRTKRSVRFPPPGEIARRNAERLRKLDDDARRRGETAAEAETSAGLVFDAVKKLFGMPSDATDEAVLDRVRLMKGRVDAAESRLMVQQHRRSATHAALKQESWGDFTSRQLHDMHRSDPKRFARLLAAKRAEKND